MEFNTGANVTALVSGQATQLTLSSYTVAPAAGTITFTVATASVTKPSTILFSNIQVRPKTGSCNTISTANMSLSGTSSATGNCGALTTVLGAASKLIFTTPPATPTVASVAFATQPVVTIEDINGNTRTGDTDIITLAAYTNAGCTTAVTAGTLAGTKTEAAVAGVADFTGNLLAYNKVGTIYLKATSGSLTSACSAAEVITVGAKNKLAFTSAAPGNSYTYNNLVVQPVVVIQDADGNTTADTDNVVIAAYTDVGCTAVATADLTGTKTVAAVAGTATFAAIKYNTVYPAGIYILATSGGLTTACSSIYRVYANASNAPVASTYTNTPTTTSAGTTTTTSAGTTTTTFVAATSVPTTIKPVAQMTVAEKTSYIQSLQMFLINLLTQLFNALKAAK